MTSTITGHDYLVGRDRTGVPQRITSNPYCSTLLVAILVDGHEHTILVSREYLDASGVPLKSFARTSEFLLWRVAELDHKGLGAHALAELERREVREVERAAAAAAERRKAMLDSAAALLAGAR